MPHMPAAATWQARLDLPPLLLLLLLLLLLRSQLTLHQCMRFSVCFRTMSTVT
jgi:hypothetical protein